MKIEPILQLSTAWTAVWRRLGVHLFEGTLTLADMDRLDAFGAQWRRRNPGKLVDLSIIFPSRARMNGEERARMAQIIKRWENERIASATVILAEGMTGSMQRSVLTGLLMLAPPPHPAKVFGSFRDAVTWLTPHLKSFGGDEATQAEVLAAVEEVCATFRARR